MAGLRDRKKSDLRRRFISVAGDLFRQNGFERTRMEDIAAAADVGLGTAYNYFSNKGDLLLAIASIEVESITEKARISLAKSIPDIGTAIDRLIAAYFDHSLEFLDKPMWRAVIALSIQQSDTEVGRRYSELDAALVKQIHDLLQSLQRSGQIAVGVEIRCAAELIYNNLTTMFNEFIKRDDFSIAEIKETIRRQNRPVVYYLSGGAAR